MLDSGHDFYKVVVGVLRSGWGRWQGQWEAERRRFGATLQMALSLGIGVDGAWVAVQIPGPALAPRLTSLIVDRTLRSLTGSLCTS